MHEKVASPEYPVHFRFAQRKDVPAIVKLLADDALGAKREKTGARETNIYYEAFEEMEAQDGNRYLLAVDPEESIIGCVQITIISGLSRARAKRAQLEGIRVAASARGKGIGKALMMEAHAIARRHGCSLAQLTTDRRRVDALRFYQGLGYERSHHGMKFYLK